MRWPWVSRALHEAVVQAAEKQAQFWAVELDGERAAHAETRIRYGNLIEKYHALVQPKPDPVLAPAPAKALGPKTTQALDEMGRGQSRAVRQGMLHAALRMHAENMSDDAIAARVRKGEPVPL